MRRILRLTMSAILGFAIAGTAAYLGGRLLREPAPGLAAVAEPVDAAVEVIPAQPIPYASDPVEVAMQTAAGLAAEAVAHESEDSGFVAPPGAGEIPTFAGEDLTDLVFGEDGAPLALPGLPLPHGGIVTDDCIGSDSPLCPAGVGGTVGSLRSLPAIHAVVRPDPLPPGAARSPWAPECEPLDSTTIGVTTNMPATMTVEVWPYERGVWILDPPAYEMATVATDAAAWAEWVEDESAGFADDRYYIDHCLGIDLEPGRYMARADAVATDGSGSFRTDPVVFTVPDGSGRMKRPTALLGFGVDVLHIATTREEGQVLHIRAFPRFDEDGCVVSGLDEILEVGPAVAVPDDQVATVIGPEVIGDPSYPYLLEHTVDVAATITLTAGEQFHLCLYWVGDPGGTIELVEGFRVGTPNAYRPTVSVLGFANLDADLDRLGLSISTPRGCSTSYSVSTESLPEADLPVPADPRSIPTFHRYRQTLCTDLRPLAYADQYGLRVTLTANGRSQTTVTPLALSCPGFDCPARPSDLVFVPVPAAEPRFGSAGYAVLEIAYSEGNRMSAAWDLGSSLDPPPGPGAITTITVAGTAVVADGRGGLRLDASVVASPATTVEVLVRDADGSEACVSGGGVGLLGDRSAEPTIETTLSVGSLCAGHTYLATFTAPGDPGLPVRIVDASGSVLPQGTVEFTTGGVPIDLSMTLRMDVDGRRVVQSSGAVITAIGRDASVTTPLDWRLTAQDWDHNLAAGWRVRDGSACKLSADGGQLRMSGLGGVLGSNDETRIRIDVDVRRIGDAGSGRLGTNCSPGSIDTTYRIDLLTDLASLEEGVRFESTDGVLSVEFAIAPG